LVGEEHGPFDLVILENGQYNQDWKYIHMMPEEVVQAAVDLRAKWLFPVHWSKFKLALHDWDEPMNRVFKEAERKNVSLVHPMIGEEINLKELKKSVAWWTDLP
jgi:L-ascorbate metabolism protein UlaG (beta-lactamase superfamily)